MSECSLIWVSLWIIGSWPISILTWTIQDLLTITYLHLVEMFHEFKVLSRIFNLQDPLNPLFIVAIIYSHKSSVMLYKYQIYCLPLIFYFAVNSQITRFVLGDDSCHYARPQDPSVFHSLSFRETVIVFQKGYGGVGQIISWLLVGVQETKKNVHLI